MSHRLVMMHVSIKFHDILLNHLKAVARKNASFTSISALGCRNL